MGDSEGGGAKFTQELSGEYRPDYPWKRVKKCACMLSFSGKNYHGMQRNFDSATGGMVPTIEGELLAALSKAGIIDPEWETKPQKALGKKKHMERTLSMVYHLLNVCHWRTRNIVTPGSAH